MSLTGTEQDRLKAGIIAETLEVVASAIITETETLGFEQESEKIRKALLKVAASLSHRGQDYEEATAPPQRGSVRTIQRELTNV